MNNYMRSIYCMLFILSMGIHSRERSNPFLLEKKEVHQSKSRADIELHGLCCVGDHYSALLLYQGNPYCVSEGEIVMGYEVIEVSGKACRLKCNETMLSLTITG